MAAAKISGFFGDIEQAQLAAQTAIAEITRVEETAGKNGEEPPQLTRAQRVKDATAKIQQIPDLIQITELYIKQVPESTARSLYWPEKIDLCRASVAHLWLKLKDAQLEASAAENAAIHKQRLRMYCAEEPGADGEESVAGQREKLFAGRTQKPETEKTPEQKLLAQNKSITSSLRLSRQLMEMSVMQTELNIDTLDQQTKDLTKFNDKLLNMDMILGQSRQIVKFIEKQDRSDKRRIYMAIGFLLVCSAWVVWRRVLKLPVKILMWTLLKAFGVVGWVSRTSFGEKPALVARDATFGGNLGVTSALADFVASTDSSADTYLHEADHSDMASMSVSMEDFEVLDSAEYATEVLETSTFDYSQPFVQDIEGEEPVMTWEVEEASVSASDVAQEPESTTVDDNLVGESLIAMPTEEETAEKSIADDEEESADDEVVVDAPEVNEAHEDIPDSQEQAAYEEQMSQSPPEVQETLPDKDSEIPDFVEGSDAAEVPEPAFVQQEPETVSLDEHQAAEEHNAAEQPIATNDHYAADEDNAVEEVKIADHYVAEEHSLEPQLDPSDDAAGSEPAESDRHNSNVESYPETDLSTETDALQAESETIREVYSEEAPESILDPDVEEMIEDFAAAAEKAQEMASMENLEDVKEEDAIAQEGTLEEADFSQKAPEAEPESEFTESHDEL